jgi:3-phenylpropionate/cinnamic acid dioxygenase small subunit
LYAQVQQFYAEQMRLLDDGAVREWAATFTEDGVFSANVHPEPTVGRAAIADAGGRATTELAAAGITRRHWLGMVAIRAVGPRRLHVRCYALVVSTQRGGASTISHSTTCDDDLIQVDGDWQVARREVRRDDLA